MSVSSDCTLMGYSMASEHNAGHFKTRMHEIGFLALKLFCYPKLQTLQRNNIMIEMEINWARQK